MNAHIADLAAVAWANGGTLSGANLWRANLGGANLAGANLEGADLRGASLADSNLVGANLAGANLSDASLADSNLVAANLSDASLAYADLAGANLVDANFRGAKNGNDTLCDRIAAVERMDGHTFILFRVEGGEHKIKAGCRWLTIPEYRAHVAAEYPGTDKARETLDILDYFQRRLA